MAGWGGVAETARGDDRRVIDGLRTMFGAVSGAARPAIFRLMMVLVLVAGVLAVSAPVQAADEVYSGSGTNIYRRYAGDYLISSSISVLYTGNSQVNEEAVSYAAFNIPANKSYTSVNLSHAHGCNYGSGVQINFSLLTRQPASNGSGMAEVRASTRFGGVVAGSGASVDGLPGSVVTEMNRLSAAGGGTLYLGVYAGTDTSVLCGFSTFNLVGETTSPAIWSVTPNRGPAAGGNTVTIAGNYLDRATSVTFGGAAGTNISASANEITVTAPAGSPGAVDVVVTTPGGSATASGAYTYIVGPSISSVSPNTGPTSGGYTVTINGNNLINATDVTFGGVSGGIGTRRPNSLEVTVPALNTPRTVDVVVTGPGGTATLTNGFTAIGAPTISGVSPNKGSRGGGQTVTITGTNLTGASTVSFGGVAGSNIVVDSATQLRVTTPVRLDGAMDVTVTTPGGIATLAGGYTFVSPSVTITSPANGGTVTTSTITVSGTAANATGVEVFLDSVSQGSVSVVNGAWSKVLSGPLGNGAHTVLVQGSDGRVPSPVVSAAFTVAVPPPAISTVSPNTGPLSGDTTVTLTGTNLSSASGVTFGGVLGRIVGTPGATQVVVMAPAHEAGTVDIFLFTADGLAIASRAYTYAAPAPVANSFTYGSTVAYNAGGASPTSFNLSSQTTNSPTGYAVGSATTAQGGSVSINNSGQVTYTPPVGVRGNDSFTYTASNNDGTSLPATVTVTIGNPTFTVTLPSAMVFQGTTYNASNIPVTISGGQGSYTITGVTGYPRDLGFDTTTKVLSGRVTESGTFTVDFTITDRSRGAGPYSATASATLVAARPPAPTAESFTAPAVAYNSGSAPATTIDLTAHVGGVVTSYNFNNGSGGPTKSITTAQGGSATVDSTGQVQYTPPVGFRGADSFEFRPSNPSAPGDWVTVTIPVSGPVFTVTLPSATGFAGLPYNPSNAPVTISGGKGPYTVTSVTGQPLGLDFDSATGVLSGTTTLRGAFTVIFTITDSSTGTGPATSLASTALTIVNPPAPTASDFTVPAVAYNAGSASATTIDLAARTSGEVGIYGLEQGGVLGGRATTANGGVATVNAATGQVSYTPPVGFRGSDSFRYRADNFGGDTGLITVTVPVDPPTFTVTLHQSTGQVGADYNRSNSPVTISGGRGPYTVTAVTGYPRDLTFDAATQVLSGRIRQDGTWTLGFTITDSSTGAGGYTSTASATLITTLPPNPVASAFTAPAVAYNRGGAPTTIIDLTPHGSGVIEEYFLFDGRGSAVSVTTTQGGAATIETTTGQVSYTPPVGFRGADSFSFLASNASGSSSAAIVTIPVSNPVFTIALPEITGQVGVPYNSGGAAVAVNGGQAPYSGFSATGLPAGLAMSSAGVISGVPTTAANATVAVTATDSSGGAGAFTFTASATLDISPPTLILTPAVGALPGGVGGTAYSQTFTTTGGIAPIRYEVTAGALPNGLSLSTGGVISGVPTETGTFNFTVTATDGSGNAYAKSGAYSITVAAPAITFTAPAAGVLPGGLRTVAYSQTFTATGGTAPYGYAVNGGAPPPGLALAADGTLSGAPTMAGSYSFTITASDAFGFTGAAAYTLEIGTPVPMVQAQTATVVGGQSVTIDVTQGATGLDFASVSVVTAPSHGTAVVQGMSIVYTADGAYAGPDSFTYTVNNAGGPSAPATVTITVHPSVVTGPQKTVTIFAGRTATVELTEGATGSPFTGAAVVSVGPTAAGRATIVPRTGQGGVQLYDLVFTPADVFTGEATVLYTLSNAFTTSAPGTVTITVQARPDPGLDPEVRGVATSQVTAARRFAAAQITNFQRRLQALRDGTNRSSNGLSLNLGLSSADEDSDPRRALRRELGQQASRQDPGALNDGRDREMLGLDLWAGRSGIDPAGRSPVSGDRLNALQTARTDGGGRSVGFWTAGSVDWGRQDADGQRDYRFTTQGVTAGLDVRVNDALIVGGGLGYGEDRTRIGDKGSLTAGSALTGALYASWRPAEAFYIDGVLGYADLDFSSHRWVQGVDDQPNGYVDGERSGQVLFVSAAFGRVIRREGLVSDFYARLDGRGITLDAFTETGGDLAALSWDALDQSSLSANVGASLGWSIETRRYGRFLPSARLEWSHELEDIGDQGVRYADWAGSPTYIVPLDAWSRDAINLDLGLEWSLTDRLMLGLGYRGMFGDASSSQGGQIGLNYGW